MLLKVNYLRHKGIYELNNLISLRQLRKNMNIRDIEDIMRAVK